MTLRFKTTAEDGEGEGQQWSAMENCSTEERLQQETLFRRQWTLDCRVRRTSHRGPISAESLTTLRQRTRQLLFLRQH